MNVRKGSGAGEDRVPRGLALDEECLNRAGPGHLQAAREVPQSPGKEKKEVKCEPNSRKFLPFFVQNFKSESTDLEISSLIYISL